MGLTVLIAAFSMAEVGPDAVGGSEQIISDLERGLVQRGHSPIVVSAPNSKVSGVHVSTGFTEAPVGPGQWTRAHEAMRRSISEALERYNVDLVHMHGIDFQNYIPEKDIPVLVTLHMPIDWYDARTLLTDRPKTYFHCVSRAQRASAEMAARFLPDVENGISNFYRPSSNFRKKDYIAALGRICPEKGFHLALEAAKQADCPLLLAGRVYPFPEHETYFAEEIIPALDRRRRFIGPVRRRAKRRLLAGAKCVVIPSLVAETSSLVAREALSCGTPVVAFDRGALRETVDHGETGYLINDASELPAAIRACVGLDPKECARIAKERFSADRMVDKYINLYREVIHLS